MSKNNSKRDILVTNALPYANGDLHLGHILEHIQSDIWVRFQRLQGNNCTYICGEDAHGTSIMLKAEEQDISPEELIKQVRVSHELDFKAFNNCKLFRSIEECKCSCMVPTILIDDSDRNW